MKMKTFVLIVILLSIAAIALHFAIAPDTFWHIRTGQIMIENREILKVDPFTFHLEGEEWFYPSLNWFSEIQMALIYNSFGFGGLNLWVAFIVLISMIFIYNSMSGNIYLRGFLLVLASATARIYYFARPHIISFLFTAIFIWVLENYRLKKGNKLWLLPIIMIIWVNSHAGFAIGLLVTLIYLTSEVIENLYKNILKSIKNLPEKFKQTPKIIFSVHTNKFILVFILLILAVCINPIGINAFSFISQTISIQALQDFIQEWQSPNFHKLHVQPFLWMNFLVFLSLALPNSKKIELTEFFAFLIFSFLGFQSTRNIYIFALIASPIISHLLTPSIHAYTSKLKDFGSENHSENKLFSMAKISVIILGFIAIAINGKQYLNKIDINEKITEKFPTDASRELQSFSSDTRILNSYDHGGYLIYSNPEQKVFIDGRTDLYGDEFLNEWIILVSMGEGWEEIFSKWDFDLVVLEPAFPITKILQFKGWKVVFEDNQAIILSNPSIRSYKK